MLEVCTCSLTRRENEKKIMSMCTCIYRQYYLNKEVRVLLNPFTAPSLSKVTELLMKRTSAPKHTELLNRNNSNMVIRKSHNKTVLHERMVDEI